MTTVSSAEHTRRDFLYIATGAVATVGAAATLVPLINPMNPDASTIAAGAPVEIDLAPIAEGQIVKTVNHFGGSQQQTVFSFAGLFDLARFSKNEQYAIHPLSDLSRIVPLKKGARTNVAFLALGPDERADTRWSLELTVAGQESFSLGECKYKVFRIKQVTKRGDEQVDILSVLYSPDLQATLAKVYDEGTADEYTVRYDRIQSLTH